MKQTLYVETTIASYLTANHLHTGIAFRGFTMIDAIVEEARQAGAAYIASFKGDLKAVCEDLRQRAKASGRPVVKLPSKAPRRHMALRK